MGIQYNFTSFGIGAGNNHETVERWIDADQGSVIVITENIPRAMLDEMQTQLIDSEPQRLWPIRRKRLLQENSIITTSGR